MPEKRYYWFKLQEDFFNRKEVKLLRKVAGGDTYTVIYLEMLLKSLKTNGKLYFEGIGDSFIEELALDIDEDIENVQVTVEYLRRKGLLLSSDEYEFELTSIKSLVGSESSGAERKRRQREREKQQLIERDNVTGQSRLGHVEIEKDIDIDKDKEQLRTDERIDNFSNRELDYPANQNMSSLSVPNASAIQTIEKAISDNGFDYSTGPYQLKQKQDLLYYITNDGMQPELVAKAIEITRSSGKSAAYYTNGILENWLAQHILTLKQLETFEAQKQGVANKYGDKQKKEIW